ncbi:LANO_0C02740g1_1 [Lachancea nothofagi CBS 11611]|uniref:LANO_0C02740g1_1 n=1 Tax=Lachancea nothofagi CBS 11611 TaxID=1266666 RepID=A0A1G4J5F4_9SACH|nr:LANO_0C02740g1_1 [Lachancea nothofagi CBS 11611]
MTSPPIDRVLYQEDYRKYKIVRNELTTFLATQQLDFNDQQLFLLLSHNVHSNGLNLYLPLMVAKIYELPETGVQYQVILHFKHHKQFPSILQLPDGQTEVSTNLPIDGSCYWNLVIPLSQYIMANVRPSGDYSHLTGSQKQKKFNGEKAKIAAQEYLNTANSSKSAVANRYGVSLSTLNDAIKRLKRQRELISNENAGHSMDYRLATDQTTRKRVASVALLNVLNSPVSPSKRCRLVPQMSFKYNIPERTLRDRLKTLNPSISKAAEGLRRRKLSQSAEQFLTTFYAICSMQNAQITVKQADAICELMATTTDCSDVKLFSSTLDENGKINLPQLLRDQETHLGKNFGWRFRQRNGFASSKAKRMDSRRLRASDVNNIAMWLNEDAFKILNSTPAELIFNADEIGFAHTLNSVNQHSRYVSLNNPNKNKRKGVVYKVKEAEADPKTLTTVTACVSAAGVIVPPMVTAASSIAKHKTECHIFNPRFETLARSKLYPGVSETVNLLFTSNGWNNSRAFFEYVKWFDAQTLHIAKEHSHDGRLRQRVLIVDNHYSHYCQNVLDFVAERRIILLLLPPNTTHVLQPLDVGVFSNLKKKVRALATEWCPSPALGPDGKARYGHFDILCNFMNALNHTLTHDFEQTTISQAFKTAGIFPPEKTLFNPAVRSVMKHFDAHAKMKDIFLTNILPVTQDSRPRARTIAGATRDDSPPSPLVPLVSNEAFFIGEDELESLDFLSVNAAEIANQAANESESEQGSQEAEDLEGVKEESSPDITLTNDFVSKFTFEDVLKLVTDLIGGENDGEELSLVPKLMERLDKCSELAFGTGSHLTITKELFLEQQANVMGIVMYLIYFGACFLGLREQSKIEEALQIYETGAETAMSSKGTTGARLTSDVLRDLSKKQFFKLFPKVSGNMDRQLSKKIATLQNTSQDAQSMSEELINELGSSVWDFLQGMVKDENSVLSLQSEELKKKVLSTALNAPEALAKAATVRSMFDHNGKLPFSKKHMPLVSKIESIGAVPDELLDPTISDQEFELRLSALREVATGALEELAAIEDSSNSLEGDTMIEDDPFDTDDKNQKILQNWFLVYHIDNVVGRITKNRENINLKKQNKIYEQKINALTQAISEMANNVRSSTDQLFYEMPDPFFDLRMVEDTFI